MHRLYLRPPLLTGSPGCSALSQAGEYESPRLAREKARRRRQRHTFEPAEYDIGFTISLLQDEIRRV